MASIADQVAEFEALVRDDPIRGLARASDLLGSDVPRLRGAALMALCEVGDPSACELALSTLEEPLTEEEGGPWWEMRWDAAYAVARYCARLSEVPREVVRRLFEIVCTAGKNEVVQYAYLSLGMVVMRTESFTVSVDFDRSMHVDGSLIERAKGLLS